MFHNFWFTVHFKWSSKRPSSFHFYLIQTLPSLSQSDCLGIGSLFRLSWFENDLDIFYKNYEVRLLISRQLHSNGEICDWGCWMTRTPRYSITTALLGSQTDQWCWEVEERKGLASELMIRLFSNFDQIIPQICQVNGSSLYLLLILLLHLLRLAWVGIQFLCNTVLTNAKFKER